MRRILICVSFVLIAALSYAASVTWTFDSDAQGWNSPAGTWNTTIAWTGAEGHDAAGAIHCTDSDVYAGVRHTVALDGSQAFYGLTAWVKLISVDNTYGLALNTWALDSDLYDGTIDPYSTATLNVWQRRTRKGTADASGYAGNGYIMINSSAPSNVGAATYDWYMDDVTYKEYPYHPYVAKQWTFDSDAEGWNSPGGTWGTTIAWTSTEGHDAAGAIHCTDSDVWTGVRNTVAVDGAGSSYTLTVWVKLVSVDNTYGLGLNTWALDKDYYDGTADAYSTAALNVWQSRTRQGAEDASGYGGNGYIMINSAAPSNVGAATYDYYMDDVVYRRFGLTGVTDWSLYSLKEE
jgi:hypothetical protein